MTLRIKCRKTEKKWRNKLILFFISIFLEKFGGQSLKRIFTDFLLIADSPISPTICSFRSGPICICSNYTNPATLLKSHLHSVSASQETLVATPRTNLSPPVKRSVVSVLSDSNRVNTSPFQRDWNLFSAICTVTSWQCGVSCAHPETKKKSFESVRCSANISCVHFVQFQPIFFLLFCNPTCHVYTLALYWPGLVYMPATLV